MAKIGELSDEKKEQAEKLARYLKNDQMNSAWERESSKRDGQSGKIAGRENYRKDIKFRNKLIEQLLRNGMDEKDARKMVDETNTYNNLSRMGWDAKVPSHIQKARDEMDEYENERGKYPLRGKQHFVDGDTYEDTRLDGDRYTGRGSVHKLDKNGKRQSGGYVGREPAYSAIKRGKAD